jgi:hypothetical protein
MDQAGQGPDRSGDTCLRCGGALRSMKLLFGEMAELGEEMIPFEVFACGNCRRVELRLSQTGS